MKVTLFFVFSLLLCLTSAAQEVLSLGQTRAEVIRILGQPEYVYSRLLSMSYSTADRDIALASSGYVDDVFKQHFSGVEFRAQVSYKSDSSLSRLHATDRVVKVEFTPDKNGSLIEIARLVPQTSALCASGCKLMGLISGYSYVAYLYPVALTAEARTNAQSVATGYQNSMDSQFHFTPCLKFEFQQKPRYGETQPPVFNLLTVDTVSLSVFDPDAERKTATVREAAW